MDFWPEGFYLGPNVNRIWKLLWPFRGIYPKKFKFSNNIERQTLTQIYDSGRRNLRHVFFFLYTTLLTINRNYNNKCGTYSLC